MNEDGVFMEAAGKELAGKEVLGAGNQRGIIFVDVKFFS